MFCNALQVAALTKECLDIGLNWAVWGGEDPLALESLRGGALIFEWRRPATNTVSCAEWTASSPALYTAEHWVRLVHTWMHTMRVIVHCAQICAQPKMHNMLRTLLAHSLAHNTDWILQYSTKWISRFVVCYVSHLAHWAIQTELVFQTAH